MANGTTVEVSKIRNATPLAALTAALTAANTPKNLVKDGVQAYLTAILDGATEDEAVGKALSGRAADGGSWWLGLWTFYHTSYGVDINASTETKADEAKAKGEEIVAKGEEIVEKGVEGVKRVGRRLGQSTASKRTDKKKAS